MFEQHEQAGELHEAEFRRGQVPIHEQYLPELLGWHGVWAVEFTTDLGSAVSRSEADFFAVGTPQGETGAANLSYVEAVAFEIACHIDGYKVIAEKSTVPVQERMDLLSVRTARHQSTGFRCGFESGVPARGAAAVDFLHPTGSWWARDQIARPMFCDRITLWLSSSRAASRMTPATHCSTRAGIASVQVRASSCALAGF